MSIHVGDAVLVHINDECRSQRIGVIEYIGYIDSDHRSKFVGINLVESVDNGHNGKINGIQHFQAPDGHAIYVRIQNIIKKLDNRELAIKMQQIIMLFKRRLSQYVTAVGDRDEYIEELKTSQRRLKKLLNKPKNTPANSNSLHTIEELMTSPPPISKMTSDDSTAAGKKNKRNNTRVKKRMKHSEYTKYSDRHKNMNIQKEKDSTEYYTSEDNDDSSDDDNTDNTTDESTDDEQWHDDYSYQSNKKHDLPTPISISTHSRQSTGTRSNRAHTHSQCPQPQPQASHRMMKKKQKSHSTNNTPRHSPTTLSVNHIDMSVSQHSVSPLIRTQQMNGTGSRSHTHVSPQNNIIHHTSFSNNAKSHSPYDQKSKPIYHPNSQNMQQLYDMMISQQQQQKQSQQQQNMNIMHTTQQLHQMQRTQTVPVTSTKRRSLHRVKPIPEPRNEMKHNRREKHAKKKLKLHNRRSNSVDMGCFNDTQILKNQVNNLKMQKQYNTHNNLHNVQNSAPIANNHQYIFTQQQQQQQTYHNTANNSPTDPLYPISQPLQDHFSAYF